MTASRSAILPAPSPALDPRSAILSGNDMTLWIFGTSVSAQREGWTTRLAACSREPIVNLSVGDQTSIMGFSRRSNISTKFMPGDVVIWEYPLLDILMVDMFGEADILAAMQNAWHTAMTMGAHVIVLLMTPLRDIEAASNFELRIRAATAKAAVPFIDLRRCFEGIGDPAAHYSGDRHIRLDSIVLDRITAAICDEIISCRNRPNPSRPPRPPVPAWRWQTAAQMGAGGIFTRENSLVSAEVSRLDASGLEALDVQPHDRLICAIVVSDHAAGSWWCGHIFCPPASCRMPEHLDYPFLLRATRIACLRGKVERLWATPEYALQQGSWSDYGFVSSSDANPVEILGVLTADRGDVA
jgi:hypothetical protein